MLVRCDLAVGVKHHAESIGFSTHKQIRQARMVDNGTIIVHLFEITYLSRSRNAKKFDQDIHSNESAGT